MNPPDKKGLAIKMACQMIKEFEGFSPVPYPDGYKRWSIGYGFNMTEDEAKALSPMDKKQAEEMLVDKVSFLYDDIISSLHNPARLGINQISALLSFVYNIGFPAFQESSVLRLINSDEPLEAAALKMLSFVYTRNKYGRKVKSKSLEERRASEVELFMSGLSRSERL